MDEREKKRQFQWVKTLSTEKFWSWMNQLHTRAYAKAVDHMREAMSCHPRISKRMVNEVLLKAEQIRTEWDGMRMVSVEATEGVEFKTATELIEGLNPTEAAVYQIEAEHMLWVKGRAFVVRPATQAEIEEAKTE